MPDLFNHGRIEHLAGVVDGDLIQVPNKSTARWAVDASGRRWVRKRASITGNEALLAEAASYLLGLELAVCQPQAAVFLDGGDRSWLSQLVPNAGEHWQDDMRDLIQNLDEVGRMLALDAITYNQDRHDRNILVEPVGDDAHLRLWAIDSGDAMIGSVEDFRACGLGYPSPANHAAGLPVEALRPAALAAAQVAAQLTHETLMQIATEACDIAQAPHAAGLVACLQRRCRNAPEITSSYLDALGALP